MGPYLTPYKKCTKDIKVRAKTIKLLAENTGKSLTLVSLMILI